jgi:hypothetical protein
VDSAADGQVDRDRVRAGLEGAGIELSDAQLDGLIEETIEHAVRVQAEAAALARLDAGPQSGGPAEPLPRLTLPEVIGGVELGALYELAEALVDQGVSAHHVAGADGGKRR